MKSLILVIPWIALTAVSWGIYGPVLHWGQHGMGEGKLRPLMCVGIAYFIIAVVVPALLMTIGGQETDAKYAWNFSGAAWSLAAGAAGAVGALGIILAFNFGGKPIYVMPLVFGCAPVVNTLFTITTNKLWGQISPWFAAGLILVAMGAATVLIFQPRAKPAAGKPGAAPKVAAAHDSATPAPPFGS